MYECVICLSLNHASRLHCQNCGTIPAQYSILGAPAKSIEHETFSQYIPVIAAFGCQRASQHKGQKVYLRTVSVNYYAS